MYRKRKRQVPFVFNNSFLYYENHKQILTFIFDEWYNRKDYFLDYTMNYPKLIHSTKWKLDYKVFRKNNDDKLNLITDEFLNLIK